MLFLGFISGKKLDFQGNEPKPQNIQFTNKYPEKHMATSILVPFPGNRILLPEMKPRNNIVYQIQYLTIFLFWTSRKISIKKSREPTACRSASPADM